MTEARLDPAPYKDKSTGFRYSVTARNAPYAEFAPRPEYSQNEEDYL